MGFSFLEVEGTVIHVVHPEHWVPANPPASVVSLLSWEAEERKRFVLFFISPKSASQKHWRNCWEGASLLTRDAEQSLKEEGEWALGQSEPTRRSRQRKKSWRTQEESGGKGRSSVLASSTPRPLPETFRVSSPLRTTAGSGRREVVRGCHHSNESEEQSEEGEQGSGRAHAKLNLKMVF